MRTGRTRHWIVALLLAVGVVVIQGMTATPASAHDVLVSTSPAAGSTVARVPSAVVLTFDAPALQPGTALVVTGPNGPAQQGAPALVDTTVRQPVKGASPAGTYRVAWRATSVDGHPVSGQFTFTARAASAPSSSVSAATAVTTTSASSRTRGGNGIPVPASLAAVLVLAVGFVVVRRRRPR